MRNLKRTLTIIAVLAGTTSAWAQTFPSRPVTLIVPFPAGGATDVALRSLASSSEKYLGQSIVIDNRPGAGGTLAPLQMATSAPPDGYVLSQIPQNVFRVGVSKSATFDPLKNFTFVIGLTGYTFGVVVRNDAPWNSFPVLLADAKERPGKITFGSSGVGTTPHIIMMQIAQQQGINWIHVPYRGSAETLNAVLGGHINAMADGTTWNEMVNSGQLRLLAIWGATRSANWPQAPTLRELGINIVANAPYGIAGPAGMDPTVVKKLHDAFRKGTEDPDYISTLRRLDQLPNYLGSKDYAEYAKREVVEQARVVKQFGLSAP